MKLNSLRVGNIVSYNYPDGDWDALKLKLEDLADVGNGEFKPMPITEKWLLKLGLTKTTYNSKESVLTIDIKSEHGSYLIFEDNELTLRDCDDGTIGEELKFIHEVQNLYFWLQKEELKIKNEISI
ncbi:MAG: hypothetical protein GY756_26965 [bacterium]|nr:hypothetical protein [bacterium]